MPTIKTVTVGDGTVGKTCLLMCYAKDKFPDEYVPTVFDSYVTQKVYKGQSLELLLNDTAGQPDYDRLRPLMYPGTQVAIICFAIDSSDSLYNVEHKWVPEIKHYLPKIPFILVGTKLDLRNKNAHGIVSVAEGKAMAKKIGATRYMECSAVTHKNMKAVFDEVMRIALEKPESPGHQTKICKFL